VLGRRVLDMSRAGHYEDAWQMPDFSGPRYSQSLARGLAILECFRAERSVLGIAEIADELGMSRSTTHRYLTTLVALGYVEQDKRRKYRLSLRVTDLGMSALNSTGLREHAHSILEELRQGSSFTVSLAMLDGQEIVYVDRVVSFQRARHDTGIGVGIGSRLPAFCTAMGKVLVAHLPEDERRELLAQVRLERRGPNAITGKGALQAELEGVLEEGFATEDEELAKGRIAIAAPIRNETGAATAAIDLSSDTSIIAVQRLISALLPHLIAAADRISARLGYRREDEIAARE
jgi:IclR family transcriptional regulator, pca regulon regulatory protein